MATRSGPGPGRGFPSASGHGSSRSRIALFTRHLSHWPAELRSKVSDPTRAAHVFSALLQTEIVDTALLGGPVPDSAAIRVRCQEAANDLLALAEAGRL
ncbi:hypothetical protein ACWGCW_07795 [Streptomyces sp. NPDC054933]